MAASDGWRAFAADRGVWLGRFRCDVSVKRMSGMSLHGCRCFTVVRVGFASELCVPISISRLTGACVREEQP